jgi:hypothetical protein
MTVVTLDDVPRLRRETMRSGSQDLHHDTARIMHAAKTLLAQGLRMLLVLSCFAAAAAAVIAARLYAFVPALHQ